MGKKAKMKKRMMTTCRSSQNVFWRVTDEQPAPHVCSSCLALHPKTLFSKLLLSCYCLVAPSCPTLCDPVDSSPPGSSVHGVLQARILEWVTITFSRGSFYPRDRTWVSCIAGRLFAISPPGKSAPPQEALKSSVCLSLSCTCCWPCNTSRWAAVLTSMGLCYTC